MWSMPWSGKSGAEERWSAAGDLPGHAVAAAKAYSGTQRERCNDCP
jgi:hypothetical protein